MLGLHVVWEINKPEITRSEKGEIRVAGLLRDPLNDDPVSYEYYPQKHLVYVQRPLGGNIRRTYTDAYYIERDIRRDEFRLFQLEEGFKVRIEMKEAL